MTQNFMGFNPIVPKVAAGVQQAAGPQTNVHYVDSMQAVLDWPTSPNEHFFFPEKNDNVIWVRDTDGNGQIRNPLKKLVYSVEDVAFGPEANFVTKEEYQQLYELVSDVNYKVARIFESLN